MGKHIAFGAPALVLTLMVAACGDDPVEPPAPAAPQGAYSVLDNGWQPFSWYAEACNEPVVIDGKYRFTSSVQENKNRRSIRWHQNVVGSGVGEVSGGQYRLSETYSGVENVGVGSTYPMTVTYGERLKLVGQGSLADLTARWRWHLTINANGAVTAEVSESSFDCGGNGPPPYQGTLVVNTTNDVDDGSCDPRHCSLREAINASNALEERDIIAFRIPGRGPHTIQPLSELPWVEDPVVIDGTTEPNFHGTPVVELDGSLAGGGNGLSIVAGGSTVRGLVVNRFDRGIWLAWAGDNVLEGNYVGTDVTGTVALGNSADGVFIEDSPGNLVGGTAPAARNVVSGNGGNGISLNGSGASANVLEGNYIGTDVTGTAALGNGNAGVLLGGSTGNLVGGTEPGAGNLISGNLEGVTFDGAFENLVWGNRIGTDAAGLIAIPNGTGVLILGDANGIGGVDPAARNLISGNLENGITLGLGASGNHIMGNLIGTDVSGTAALGNGGRGIWLSDAYANVVGGGAEGAPNVISGNYGGITLTEGSQGNQITGNLIGTDVSGTGALGNDRSGIFLSNSAADNAIGTRWAGSENVIAFNGSGIRMVNTAGSGNSVRRNSIFENGGLGMDIGDAGVTDNDVLDEDEGSNDVQNFPVLEEFDASHIAGYLHSTPDTRFRVEFFANGACDPSGHGEGEIVLGSMSVTTDGNGDAGFEFFGVIPVESFLTATATSATGSTSEFSACIPET